MWFFLCVSGFLLVLFFAFRFFKVKRPFAKVILVAFGISLVVDICLAQNFTASLIPGAYDGIAISNSVAYWIITDDVRWTSLLFKRYFEGALLVSFLFLLVFSISLLKERRSIVKP